ncbi:MAG: sporulation protein YqfC [Dethiobacteria bacterium]
MRRKGGTSWKNVFADIFELPKDIMLDVPRLVLIGNLQLFLENHRGIIEYGERKIRIAVSNGEIAVSGKGLQIRSLLSQELSIEGVIEGIAYEE